MAAKKKAAARAGAQAKKGPAAAAPAKKRGRGRPSRDLPPHLVPGERLVVRASELDLELWLETARRDGFPRGELARELLNARMEKLIPPAERKRMEADVIARVEYEATLTPKELKAVRAERQKARMIDAWQTDSRLKLREAAAERRGQVATPSKKKAAVKKITAKKAGGRGRKAS